MLKVFERKPSEYRFATTTEWDYWNSGGEIPGTIWVRNPAGGVDMAIPSYVPENYYL